MDLRSAPERAFEHGNFISVPTVPEALQGEGRACRQKSRLHAMQDSDDSAATNRVGGTIPSYGGTGDRGFG